ncbi:MAG TPA: hypothetical protein GX727_02150 [Clostridium sp.]|jgi:acyl carrier protein|nr:hypothetical protein [Clostridium sp.]
MDRNEILNKLREIFSDKLKIVSNPEMVNESTNLSTDYNIDSMKVISLIVELEELFGISIDSEDITIETLTEVGKLITFIENGK